MPSFTRQASEHGGGFGLMSSTSMCITCAIVPAPDIYLYIVTDLPPPRQPKSCNPFITSTYDGSGGSEPPSELCYLLLRLLIRHGATK